MKKLSIFILIIMLILPLSIANADNLLNKGEIILDQRINHDGSKEIFTELNGNYYRKVLVEGQLVEEEQIKMRPGGL